MDTAIDKLSRKPVRAEHADRYLAYVCSECREEVRLFHGSQREAHFRHRVANAACGLSVESEGAALGPRQAIPTALVFDGGPPVQLFDEVTRIVTVVAEEPARRQPVVVEREHGASRVVKDMVFAGPNAGGVRIETGRPLFAGEDYVFLGAPPMALADRTSRDAHGLSRLSFSAGDIASHAPLRSWAAGEGFHLRPVRDVVDVRSPGKRKLRNTDVDETSVLLWSPGWHAAVTIRSAEFRWRLVIRRREPICLRGVAIARGPDAFGGSKVEFVVEAPGVRGPRVEYARRSGRVLSVRFELATEGRPLAFELLPNLAPPIAPEPPIALEARSAPVPAPAAAVAPPFPSPVLATLLPSRMPETAPSLLVQPQTARLENENRIKTVCSHCGEAIGDVPIAEHTRFCLGRRGPPPGTRQCPDCRRIFLKDSFAEHRTKCTATPAT